MNDVSETEKKYNKKDWDALMTLKGKTLKAYMHNNFLSHLPPSFLI